jgi:hypothetical protein
MECMGEDKFRNNLPLRFDFRTCFGSLIISAILFVVGCDVAPPSQIQARLFDIARDSTLPYAVRSAAALGLTRGERAKLQQVLMSGFPGKWDGTAEANLSILAEIGDESEARQLEQMYQGVSPVVTAWDQHNLKEVYHEALLHNAVADIRIGLGTHRFEIAEDPFVDGDKRIHALVWLAQDDRERLKAIILQRLRLPHWDEATASDVMVLAAIGDENEAKLIESIRDHYDLGSKPSTTMYWTIRQIRRRELPTTMHVVTPGEEEDFVNYFPDP